VDENGLVVLVSGAGAVVAALIALAGVIWSQQRLDRRNRDARALEQVQLAANWALSDDPARSDVGVAMLVAAGRLGVTDEIHAVIAAVLNAVLDPALTAYDEVTASGDQGRMVLAEPDAAEHSTVPRRDPEEGPQR
jgi:hypothetical protein